MIFNHQNAYTTFLTRAFFGYTKTPTQTSTYTSTFLIPATALLYRWRIMECSHMFLWETLCRPPNDRVLPMSHLDPPLLCQNKEEQRPGSVHMPEVPSKGRQNYSEKKVTRRPQWRWPSIGHPTVCVYVLCVWPATQYILQTSITVHYALMFMQLPSQQHYRPIFFTPPNQTLPPPPLLSAIFQTVLCCTPFLIPFLLRIPVVAKPEDNYYTIAESRLGGLHS